MEQPMAVLSPQQTERRKKRIQSRLLAASAEWGANFAAKRGMSRQAVALITKQIKTDVVVK